MTPQPNTAPYVQLPAGYNPHKAKPARSKHPHAPVTLQLWVDGQMVAEKEYRRTLAGAINLLKASHGWATARKDWAIYQVLPSKLNGNLEQYAREETEAVALTKTRAA